MNYHNCIYMYINKFNNHRYIGQAKDFNKRHKQHLNKNKQLIDIKIKEYGIENFDIVILKKDLKNQEELNYWECYYIKYYNTLSCRKGGKGYNISDGGSKGNTLAGKTEDELKEIGEKISKARIDKEVAKGNKNPMYGKRHSEETKDKMKKNHYDCKGKNNPMYGNCKSVGQYDKNGNLVKVYRSSEEASEEIGISKVVILRVCKFWSINCNKEEWFKTNKNRPCKTAGGFIWKYVEEM